MVASLQNNSEKRTRKKKQTTSTRYYFWFRKLRILGKQLCNASTAVRLFPGCLCQAGVRDKTLAWTGPLVWPHPAVLESKPWTMWFVFANFNLFTRKCRLLPRETYWIFSLVRALPDTNRFMFNRAWMQFHLDISLQCTISWVPDFHYFFVSNQESRTSSGAGFLTITKKQGKHD